MSHAILSALGLHGEQSGSYLGQGEWSKTTDAGALQPVNPASGELLGTVHASSAADYEVIVKRAQAAFMVWRSTPAPQRGEAVRLCSATSIRHAHPRFRHLCDPLQRFLVIFV